MVEKSLICGIKPIANEIQNKKGKTVEIKE